MLAHDLWRERLHKPAYRVGQAAIYAGISSQTVKDWEYQQNSRPSVLSKREPKEGVSFLQLIEIAVVAEMRKLGTPLSQIRQARGYLANLFEVEFPFAQLKFSSDGVDVLMDMSGSVRDQLKEKLLVANRNGQFIWTFALSNRLQEFNYGSDGFVDLWRVNGVNSDIIITPKIAFGAPSIFGVSTLAIKQRWIDGYSVSDIGDDLEINHNGVLEALRFERIEVDEERRSLWLH
jgi:uncharacterized protein (DUF433 family)